MWLCIFLLFWPTGWVISFVLRCIAKEGTHLHFIAVYSYLAFGIIVSSSIYLLIRLIIFPVYPNNLMDHLHNMTIIFFNQFRMSVKKINPENLKNQGGSVVVVNHQSIFDPFVVYSLSDYAKKMVPVAKRSLFYLGPFGLSLWLAGFVAIDRSNQKEARKTMERVTKVIQGDESKIVVFVEGTRNTKVNKTRQLLPFKTGAFKMAIECQVPIIPLVISPYYNIISQFNFFGKGEIGIKVLPPIETKGLTPEDTKKLMMDTREQMQKAYSEFVEEIEKRVPPSHPYMLIKNQ